ncbi:hypothetical protein JTB14_008637 [Gonioctena quinquepunctata]|nr:hypothetical protein JTB14_008637 [Gonioctena quinquepunctata]
MSGQHGHGTPPRILKSSPSLTKQGPLKATIPISSVMKKSSSLKSSNSATVSPTYLWKNKSDQPSGRRSPGSSYKEKTKLSDEPSSIRRTASLDTIYLKGQWPRDSFYWYTRTLQINKATQTDESDYSDPKKFHCISDYEMEKSMLRQKVKSTKEQGGRRASSAESTFNSSSQTLFSGNLSPTLTTNPLPITMKPLPKSPLRSSVEGLNQEIETIVMKSDESHSSRSLDTPEGHRAPLAEILRNTRSHSINTQTPQEFRSSSHSSGESLGSSPDQETSKLGSSPQINKFIAREPPHGCEKVQSKSMNCKKSLPMEHVPQLCTFKLKPSLGSAFQILQPNLNKSSEQDLPLVPSRQDDDD